MWYLFGHVILMQCKMVGSVTEAEKQWKIQRSACFLSRCQKVVKRIKYKQYRLLAIAAMFVPNFNIDGNICTSLKVMHKELWEGINNSDVNEDAPSHVIVPKSQIVILLRDMYTSFFFFPTAVLQYTEMGTILLYTAGENFGSSWTFFTFSDRVRLVWVAFLTLIKESTI